MNRLTLDFDYYHEVGIRIKGLSLNSLEKFSSIKQAMFKSDGGSWALDFSLKWNGDRAKPEFRDLVSHLVELQETHPFDKIRIIGTYYKTETEILEAVNNELNLSK